MSSPAPAELVAWFRDEVTTPRRAAELAEWPGKVIGTYCNFVPEELILALGAVPVRLCAGDLDAIPDGEALLPREVCSVVRSSAGTLQRGGGLAGRADLLVIPTPCDAKKKLGAVVEHLKPVHVLELPPRKDSPAARAFWAEQVRGLLAALERLTGRRLRRRALHGAIALVNRREEAFRRLLRLRQADPPALSGEDFLFVTQASFTADAAAWAEHTEALCAVLEARPARPANGRRVLLTGAPLIWPNHKVVQLLEQAGAAVVADELCSGTQRLYQPVALREVSMRALLDAVAEKAMLPSTCPCFVEGGDRLNRIVDLAREAHVAGVVYHSQRLCPLFEIEAMLVQKELRARAIPLLTLSTDFSREDSGQLRTRIDAFLEMLGDGRA
ncbi:MAG: 2-hydroxyacyl-CoA dehydratase [Armatimonadetes bacterium]|nr:2-hydroxyacyl-CoA dehydratase [Armatimonadota bacterium]